MPKIVSAWNEFDPLKHVIVGRCDHSCIPPFEPGNRMETDIDGPMHGSWGPRPLETVEKGNAELDNLAKVLEKRGIKVDRPTPINWNQPVITPDFKIDSMLTCMPPRDILLTLGNEIIEVPSPLRCRYWEHLAYRPLLEQYFNDDPEFIWTQAPRPRLQDRDYRPGYLEVTDEQERIRRAAAAEYVITEEEILFEAADVLRLGKDLFIQVSNVTNRKALEWIKRHRPDLRIHWCHFPGDLEPGHIDATFAPLRPGLILNNPVRKMPEGQRRIFEANDWQIVECAKPAHNGPQPLGYCSQWLSMNFLVLDHNTVVVEASEVNQMEQMDKLGMNVVPMPLLNAYPFGGGLHCSTADVYREGGCEDYFPNQKVHDITMF
ncbi:serine/threonine protein kinase [Laribacter hongkongensis]|uniref:serine/threonine protein kinase n=1 Tax=Laribacter hongkongensis TaxID=168471 RepID=UPI0023D8EEC8|nr:serine/threonine protein kinase [Laribacter hongkongensis]